MLTAFLLALVSMLVFVHPPPTTYSSSRIRRAMGEMVFAIKGFDNCTDEGKGQLKWQSAKMKFGKNSKAVFSGILHLGFPLTDDGTTNVKMTTYTWQNGGWKMLFKSDTSSIFSLLRRISPETYNGLYKCFGLKQSILPPGDHNCSDWHMDPFKKALPLSIKTKAYVNLDFYRKNQKMGCTKVIFDIS